MKPRELFYLLGFRPRPRVHPYEVATLDVAGEGPVEFARWLHPYEKPKGVDAAAVAELRRYIAPGDVAIDIGAHTGDSTVPMALAAGAEGCVLAFEPNPYVFPVLEENARRNRDRTHILPLMFAATPSAGEFEFNYSDAGFCNGGMHDGIARWRHGHAFRLTVRGENLQAYMEREHLHLVRRLRFVKVDAEGFDHAILESIAGLLRAQRPFVKAEVFKHLDLERRRAFYDFLVDLGYEVFRVASDANYRGERLDRDGLMAHRHYDVFCVPATDGA